MMGNEMIGLEAVIGGLIALIIAVPMAYILWLFAKGIGCEVNTEEAESAYECAAIKRHAKNNGIDIDKEIIKNSMLAKMRGRRTFGKELRREIMEEMFKTKTGDKE